MLQKRGIVVPNVNIPILRSQYCYIGVTFDHKYLGTADLFAPSGFESFSVDYSKLSPIGSKHEVGGFVVDQIIA